MSATYKSKKILVKRTYQILALIVLILAAGLVLLPKQQKHEGVSPDVFVKNSTSAERYISTDDFANRIINQDPSLLIIDTRNKEAFDNFTLPSAINIPLTEFFNEDLNDYLDQDIYDVVLFSNDNFLANEMWMIGNRIGYKRLYVLKGGLNKWFSTIINPKKPAETMSRKAQELYSFRIAAGKYFGVDNDTVEIVTTAPVKTPKKKKVITKPKKKKRIPEGGC